MARNGLAIRYAAVFLMCLFFLLIPPGTLPSRAISGAVSGGFDGFDSCDSPTITEMQYLWSNQPTWSYAGVYLGGQTAQYYGCGQVPNSSWVDNVVNGPTYGNSMEWGLIPIWDDLQAPCRGQPASTSFSYDPTVALTQGENSGNEAITAAQNFGIVGNSVIYLDLEGYDTTNQSCRSAASQYVRGFDAALYQNGTPFTPGVYGSACASAPTDWAGLGPQVPAGVMLAATNVGDTVWGLSCIGDGDWSYDQRIHQYGGNTAFVGDRNIGIDNDCVNGLVTPYSYDDVRDTSGEGGGYDPVEDPKCSSS
jgi:hypothetical protein